MSIDEFEQMDEERLDSGKRVMAEEWIKTRIGSVLREYARVDLALRISSSRQ